MADPWQCPSCRDWLAPTVTAHRCAEKPAESAKPPGYAGHNGGSFERVASVSYEPVRSFGFRP